PPKRFGNATFENYLPQHPTQSHARERVREFVSSGRPGNGRTSGPNHLFGWLGRRKETGAGLYLDGGFGVGKTHLLAAAYAERDTPDKRYLSFQQLVYVIGALRLAAPKEELASTELLCIEEVELDDPGNTLIGTNLPAGAVGQGARVVTTSNAPPEAQGKGRFNAEDFQREIQSLSKGFEVLPVDGPDFRARHAGGAWLTERQLLELEAREASPPPRLTVTWDELLTTLGEHHPSRLGGLLQQVGSVYVHGARPIPDQNDALRFVHFVDQLYDRNLLLRVSGVGQIIDVFDVTYRESAYAKKHHRCASRLTELLAEA